MPKPNVRLRVNDDGLISLHVPIDKQIAEQALRDRRCSVCMTIAPDDWEKMLRTLGYRKEDWTPDSDDDTE